MAAASAMACRCAEAPLAFAKWEVRCNPNATDGAAGDVREVVASFSRKARRCWETIANGTTTELTHTCAVQGTLHTFEERGGPGRHPDLQRGRIDQNLAPKRVSPFPFSLAGLSALPVHGSCHCNINRSRRSVAQVAVNTFLRFRLCKLSRKEAWFAMFCGKHKIRNDSPLM
jgi:hypothetical protein